MDDKQIEQALFDERMRTYHRMEEIRGILKEDKVGADIWASLIKEFCECDDLNRVCWRELDCFNNTGHWFGEHPLTRES